MSNAKLKSNEFLFTGKIKKIINKPNSTICRIVTNGFSKMNYPSIHFIGKSKELLNDINVDDYVTIKGHVRSFKNIAEDNNNRSVYFFNQIFIADEVSLAKSISEEDFGVTSGEKRYRFENKVYLKGTIRKINVWNDNYLGLILQTEEKSKINTVKLTAKTTDIEKFKEKYKVGDKICVTAIASTRLFEKDGRKFSKEELLCDVLIKE